MRAFASPSQSRMGSSLTCSLTIASALAGCAHRPPSPPPHPGDPSVRLEERRELSVTADPAVMGNVPTGMIRRGPPATGSVHVAPGEENELDEFAKRFEKSRAPKILETELSPGATGSVELPLQGPSGLSGSVEWVGTRDALKVVIAVDGAPIATGTAYRIGTQTGGSVLDAQTAGGARASLAVTNTTTAPVQVRVLLVATLR